MKERLTAIFLFLLFLIFSCWQIAEKRSVKVLKIITPTLLQIDLNGNNFPDDGETICVDGVVTFSANLPYYNDNLAYKQNLTFEQAIGVGYLTDKFAEEILLGHDVKVEFSGKSKPECRFADIVVDKNNYTDILLNNGYGISTDKPLSKNIIEQAKNLKLVILNHKSSKYHHLNCKYGRSAHDVVVIPEKELPKEAKPCKFCQLTPPEKRFITLHKEVVPPRNTITDGNIKLILTDFTTILKPDKDCSHPVCREFVKLIDGTSESIDIALYGWSDIKMVNEALDRAKMRGVEIRIVYDVAISKENYYPETAEFVKRFEQTRSDEIPDSKPLSNMLMHNKFAILDGKIVYTGSMNFSSTGFSGFNHNSVVIINSPSVAEIYGREFNQMFNGAFHTLKEATSNNTHLKNGTGELSVYFSPQDKGLTTGVLPLIQNAKRYIYIPTFILTHDTLSKALIAAKERGVNVRIIIDATSTGITHSKVKLLRDAGIPLKTENYAGKMHAKSMIIDDEYVVLGSANFSNSGENKNDENMLVIKSQKLAGLYRDYFLYFWEKIPEKYMKYNVSAESKYSIGSCSDGVDNDFDGKIDIQDEGCKK